MSSSPCGRPSAEQARLTGTCGLLPYCLPATCRRFPGKKRGDFNGGNQTLQGLLFFFITVAGEKVKLSSSDSGRTTFLIWNSLCKHSTVSMDVNPSSVSLTHVFCDCSMQGENEQILPPFKSFNLVDTAVQFKCHMTLPDFLRDLAACGTANQGLGRSRKTASATSSKS